MKDYSEFTAQNFTPALYEKLVARLAEAADTAYRAFHARLLPPGTAILGVRMPVLKEIAQAIARGNWREYLAVSKNAWYEETMLQGFVLGYARAEGEEILRYLELFLGRIDNWAVCDSTAANLKIAAKRRDLFYPKACEWAADTDEYTARFGFVLLLDYYVEKQTLSEIFALCDGAVCGDFYAQVAVAWLVSVCFVKFPEQTKEYLGRCALSGETYRKSVRKIVESYRVSAEDKHYVRNLRRQ